VQNGEIVTRLNHLIQVDIDAINAYSQAILALEPGPVRDQLSAFRGDHERHVVDLSRIVREHGGSPRERRDLMGFMVEGFTAASSALGATAALTAMRSNEELTSRTYERAMTLDFPADAKAVVARNYDDELRHREYISRQLRGEGR
jgi:uncharacterized protein (TIGR02284 family)